MSRRIDITGNVFGRWTVLEYDETKKGRAYWKCRCACGTVRIVEGGNLRDGLTKSCGCFEKESARAKFTKHGKRYSRIYRIYTAMKKRCSNPNDMRYQDYGGRGINVCDEWKNEFMEFYNWSLKNGYANNLTIDRIDVNGPYDPSNCKWSTTKEQGRNKRNNRLLMFNGITKSLAEWSEEYNIGHSTILRRLELHWSIEEAITKPVRGKA